MCVEWAITTSPVTLITHYLGTHASLQLMVPTDPGSCFVCDSCCNHHAHCACCTHPSRSVHVPCPCSHDLALPLTNTPQSPPPPPPCSHSHSHFAPPPTPHLPITTISTTTITTTPAVSAVVIHAMHKDNPEMVRILNEFSVKTGTTVVWMADGPEVAARRAAAREAAAREAAERVRGRCVGCWS